MPFNRSIERPDEVLEAFQRVQALDGVAYIVRALRSSHCVLVNTLTGILKPTLDQPASDVDGDIHLFLEGEVYNMDEIEKQAHAPAGSPQCRVLLALFCERGPDMASLLDGAFNMVVYEERAARLTILNDRMSIKPFYYAEENGGLLFASEKKSILAVRDREARLDPVGLLQIFAHRHNVLGRTYIEGLKRLPPASCLTFEGGRLQVRPYERLRYVDRHPLPRIPDLIDEWCHCLRTDVERRIRGKERVLLFLSGGVDSRAVACAIPHDIRPLAARTRGAADSAEVVCAAKVAERLGFRHFRDDPAYVPYSDILWNAAWRAECEVSLLNCMSLADHQRMKSHGDIIFGGQSGEVAVGSHVYAYMFLPASRDAFLDRVFRRYTLHPEPVLRRVFQESFVRSFYPLVKEEFKRSFGQEEESHADSYLTWNLRERQPRMTLSPGAVDTPLFEHVYALLGKENLSFALRLPMRLRYGAALYHTMVCHLGPEVRDVAYANTGLRLRCTVLGNQLNKGLDLSRKAARLLLRRLHLAAPQKRSASIANVASALRGDPAIRKCIEGFLGSSDFDSAIFNREGILSIVEDHHRGRADWARLIGLLATFSVGLPWFVYARPRSCPGEVDFVPSAVGVR